MRRYAEACEVPVTTFPPPCPPPVLLMLFLIIVWSFIWQQSFCFADYYLRRKLLGGHCTEQARQLHPGVTILWPGSVCRPQKGFGLPGESTELFQVCAQAIMQIRCHPKPLCGALAL